MSDRASSNPYQSLADPDEGHPGADARHGFAAGPLRRGLSLFAVLMGVAVDWGLTKLLVPRYLDWVQATYGPEAFIEVLAEGPVRWGWSGLGWSCSVAGGFVTGWLAGRRELRHGLGNLLMTACLIRLEAYATDLPLTPDADFLIAQSGNIISILLGAQLALWLRRYRNRARA